MPLVVYCIPTLNFNWDSLTNLNHNLIPTVEKVITPSKENYLHSACILYPWNKIYMYTDKYQKISNDRLNNISNLRQIEIERISNPFQLISYLEQLELNGTQTISLICDLKYSSQLIQKYNSNPKITFVSKKI